MASAIAAVVSVIVSSSSLLATVVKIGLAVAVQVIGAKRQKDAMRSRGRSGLTMTVNEPDFPRRLIYGRARVGGIRVYMESSDNNNKYLHIVHAIAEGPIESLDAIYFNEDRVPLVVDGVDADGVDRYVPDPGHPDGQVYYTTIPHVRIKYYNGTQTTADADLKAESVNWTEDHKLLGIAYVYVRLKYNAEIFEQGLPEMSFEVTGLNNIYDPRSDTTGYSNDAALCWNHYLTSTYGPGAGADEVNQADLIASANVCDETVSVLEGGTAPRYAVNGVVTLEDHPRDILADFQAAMSGWRTFAGGQFHLYAGAHETPTFEITEDMLAGPVQVKNKVPKRDRHNVVNALYYSEEHRWQFTDAPVLENAAYIAEDGEELPLSMELTLVNRGHHAQRLAKIELERARQQVTVNLTCSLRAFPAVAGRTVTLTLPRYGWDEKIFMVISSQPVFEKNGECLMALTLRETASSIYDWTTADEKEVTAPPEIVNSETGDPADEAYYITASPAASTLTPGDYPATITLTTVIDVANGGNNSLYRFSGKSLSSMSAAAGNVGNYTITATQQVDEGDTIYVYALYNTAGGDTVATRTAIFNY